MSDIIGEILFWLVIICLSLCVVAVIYSVTNPDQYIIIETNNIVSSNDDYDCKSGYLFIRQYKTGVAQVIGDNGKPLHCRVIAGITK